MMTGQNIVWTTWWLVVSSEFTYMTKRPHSSQWKHLLSNLKVMLIIFFNSRRVQHQMKAETLSNLFSLWYHDGSENLWQLHYKTQYFIPFISSRYTRPSSVLGQFERSAPYFPVIVSVIFSCISCKNAAWFWAD